MKVLFPRFSPILGVQRARLGAFNDCGGLPPATFAATPPEIVNGPLKWDLALRSVVKPML